MIHEQFSLGYQIKKARQLRHFTQDKLAKIMNVSRLSISHWEHDIHFPTGEHLLNLSIVLDYEFIISARKLYQYDDKTEYNPYILMTA